MVITYVHTVVAVPIVIFWSRKNPSNSTLRNYFLWVFIRDELQKLFICCPSSWTLLPRPIQSNSKGGRCLTSTFSALPGDSVLLFGGRSLIALKAVPPLPRSCFLDDIINIAAASSVYGSRGDTFGVVVAITTFPFRRPHFPGESAEDSLSLILKP